MKKNIILIQTQKKNSLTSMNKKNSLLVLILFISSYKKNHNVANFISLN